MAATQDGPLDSLSAGRGRILVPRAPGPRKVGPGRLERGYQARVAALEERVQATQTRERALERELSGTRGELEVAARLERGLQRLADRLEDRVASGEQAQKRLLLAMGALQKENELLRERLALGAGQGPRRLSAGERSARRTRGAGRAPPRTGGWLRRLLRRR